MEISRSLRALWVLSKYGRLAAGKFARNGSMLCLAGTTFSVTAADTEWLIPSSDLVYDLISGRRSSLTLDPRTKKIILSSGKVRFYVQTWEDIYIAHEVFYCGHYRLLQNDPYVFVDVGSNVGIASLAFAQSSKCLVCYGFEPAKPTYDALHENLALNPAVASKIKVENFGLAAEDRQAMFEYSFAYKGSSGESGLPEVVRQAAGSTGITSMNVHLKSASNVLSAIAARHPGTPIICKIDCEGAEFEIIESLSKANLLGLVDTFLIEWHSKGPWDLENHLRNAGFRVLSLAEKDHGVGMIYGWKPERKAEASLLA